MLARISMLLAFLVALPAFCQVEPSAAGGAVAPEDQSEMMTPPPVSGLLYPNIARTDVRSNYLSAAVTANVAYIDNVLPAATATPLNDYLPVSDYIYSILPTFSLDRTTPLQHLTMTYRPAIAFYTPTSALNNVDHDAEIVFQDRLSPNVSISLQDFFLRTSNVFNESYPFAAGGLTGTTQTPVPAVIAPFAEQMRNIANGAFTYQFGANAMVGGGGSVINYDFPNPTLTTGLYNSNGGGGSGFYTRRFARSQYFGVTYDYFRTISSPSSAQVTTQTQSVLPFYTLYLNRTFSVSVSAGGENVNITQPQLPTYNSWLPAIVASMGVQGNRGNLAASYLHIITDGGGLLGAYNSTSANASGGWKFTNSWTGSVALSYGTISPVTLVAGSPYQGGNTLTAGISLVHTFSDHLLMEVGYNRLHENFAGITAIKVDPDSNREYVTVTYQFKKPLGR